MCCRVDGRNSFLFLFSSDSKKFRLCVFFFGWFMQKNGIKGGRSLRSLVPDKQIRVAEKLSTKKKVPIGRRRWFIVFQTHPNIVGKKKKKNFFFIIVIIIIIIIRIEFCFFLIHTEFNRSCWSFWSASVEIFPAERENVEILRCALRVV